MGGWSHPEISLEDLLKLIKGFVDILILASGYQSSGRFAHWDPLNIKKAFQWGLFFENVFESIDGNQDSMAELDAALSKLTSDPHFPQGLTHISSTTLGKARFFILEHFIRTLPMRDEHLKSVLKATIEMDLDELQRTETDYLDVYLDKLMLQNTTRSPPASVVEGKMDFSPRPSPKAKTYTKTDLTAFAIQGITKRQLAVSCVSSIETSFDVVSKTIAQGTSNELQEQQKAYVWSNWRMKTLTYLLDKQTIRLVSGASMIFSAPKIQWIQVFEQLDTSSEEIETFELLLMGCISRRWNHVIKQFMSSCNEPFSIYTLYEGVHNLILKRFQNVKLMEETKDSKFKEHEIVEYLDAKLSNQIHRLWEIPPALVASSLPPWSRLFEAYASELLSQFKGKTTKIRCCSCSDGDKEHTECEVAERIWCLYIFHVSKIQT
ncbi:hypothetical protein Lser_V15G39017 [Lactuca serriola]